MNILHVALGLPPLRTGGLTRYCSELMEAQVAAGDRVSLAYPGRFLPGVVRFKKGGWHGVDTYELINPLPVALTFGVAEPNAYVRQCDDTEVFKRLFGDVAPDVIHVHSFMGIYLEFFQVAKTMGIPMVFTTHDYYAMCPRCTFIDAGGAPCSTGPRPDSCAACCRGGMGKRKSMIMQSGLYAALKQAGVMKKLAASVKREMSSKGTDEAVALEQVQIESYARLLDYNKAVFDLFDLVLSNSRMTENTFRSVFSNSRFMLVRISHTGLSRPSCRREMQGQDNILVLGYFGGKKEYKGYGTLMAAAQMLHDEKFPFEMRLYGDEYGELEVAEARSCGCVPPDEIRGILRELDAVVVPSIYHETFGFVVLEALCEGLPVVCSDAVGASELVSPAAVFPAGDARALADRIMALRRETGGAKEIPADYPLTMEQQVTEIKHSYQAAMEVAHHGQK